MNEIAQATRTKRPETCRMFENELLEKFSRIHPVTPFVVYVPLIGAMIYRTWTHHVPVVSAVGLGFGGLLVWTFAEYFLHRFIFHWTNDTPWGRRLHFLLHGVHHDFPNDGDRLVMPLLTSAPLAVIFYALFVSVVGSANVSPLFAGFALGYLCYDGTHYAVHRFKQTSRIGKFLKRHHMLHHHADHDGGFGVSSPLWDYVFGTMPQVRKLGSTRASNATTN